MNLFLDDERDPQNVTWVEYKHPYTWTVAQSYNQFVMQIQKNGIPEVVSLDCDLCEEHYMWYMQGEYNWRNFRVPCGIHCLLYLVDECKKQNKPIPEVYIHTMNAIGRQIMVGLLRGYKAQKLTYPV